MTFSLASPLLLGALLLLPVLWFLLRATPPPPRETAFGGLHFLEGLRTPRAEAARTPWPLLLLRLLAAALLIVGLAGPALNEPEAAGDGPLLVVVDDGWTAAPGWSPRVAALRREAERPGPSRSVSLLLTAAERPEVEGPMTASEAADRLAGHAPTARLPNDEGAWRALADAPRGEVLFLPAAAADTSARPRFLRALGEVGPMRVLRSPGAEALAITGLGADGPGLTARLARTPAGAGREGSLRVVARDGRVLTREPYAFESGAAEASVAIDLPLALRNQAGRIEITEARSAGGTWLVDRSARRVRVGLPRGTGAATGLLTGEPYLREALAPLSVLIEGDLPSLIEAQSDVLVLDDVGTLRAQDEADLLAWLREGGLLLRFAGPATAAAAPLGETWPAPLRGGERRFGGALTWETPQGLAPFPEGSPFEGMAPPPVTVTQQVLTRAGADPLVWARLEDGTPLVTARRIGEGVSVLFHVTASPDWSDLPLSGAMPSLLRRLLALAGRSAEGLDAREALPALALLDGTGALAPPAIDVPPILPADLASGTARPGLYGRRDAPVAVNAYDGTPALAAPTRGLPPGARVLALDAARTVRLGPWLIAGALALLAFDALWVAAGAGRRAVAAVLAATAVPALLTLAPSAEAQPRPPLDPRAVEAATRTRFAHVLTGEPGTDALTRAGLATLSRQATLRSALEPAEPVGVNPARDDLSVYPLLYWPITAGGPEPSDAALSRIEAYMAGGGLLVLDTRDGERQAAGETPEQARLRAILTRMNVPPLEPLPEGHVLGLSFYRLDDLTGRNAGGPVWVEATGGGGARDGVPSLIIGGRDWAAAWARDERGRPLRPGGAQQGEMAIRAGINMAMVALTGSYKTDQVHVQSLLDRLGEETP